MTPPELKINVSLINGGTFAPMKDCSPSNQVADNSFDTKQALVGLVRLLARRAARESLREQEGS